VTGPATSALPLDITTMRAATGRVLGRGAGPLSDEGLETLRLQLRGHLQLLHPEVERAASLLPRGDDLRERALTGVGEARMKLRLGPGDTLFVRLSVVKKLARSVRALCDDYESLPGEGAP
jgi:hypothetical protein